MGALVKEWLVTDSRGAFAMGTLDGVRTRKYHGFFLGIPGRTETAYLLDLNLECNGVPLWQHQYLGPNGTVRHPDLELLEAAEIELESRLTRFGPSWLWKSNEGRLSFTVEATAPAGIGLRWRWKSRKKKSAHLKIRGFWGMRPLHSLGVSEWRAAIRPSIDRGASLLFISSPKQDSKISLLLRGDWKWTSDPIWYQNFYYSEEHDRGYPAKEDLFSAGVLEIQLESDQECDWVQSLDPATFEQTVTYPVQHRPAIADFILKDPPGITAGFPWFGEWGRDTFISLPGIVAATLNTEDPTPMELDPIELMQRWGAWIRERGQIPNIIEKNGKTQWDSSDATLWWCHSLASLWAFSLTPSANALPLFPSLKQDFGALLNLAIDSIQQGRHRFLRLTSEGLLEVTEPHTTWMDAQVAGKAVTPRMGLLPEINSLWFQALCLQSHWNLGTQAPDLAKLAKRTLLCKEPHRPNTVFLHSIPLAPSFVLNDKFAIEQDLLTLSEKLWTPVGLRTLSPDHPHYRAHYSGSPQQRDEAYHQGPVWAWLGGQFEAARHRLSTGQSTDRMFTFQVLNEMPIAGHIAELFDPEPPFTPRGAPAQAWSLACFEEAKMRRRLKIDQKLRRVICGQVDKYAY